MILGIVSMTSLTIPTRIRRWLLVTHDVVGQKSGTKKVVLVLYVVIVVSNGIVNKHFFRSPVKRLSSIVFFIITFAGS